MLSSAILILFINMLWNFQFMSSLSSCYMDDNKARFCQPNFVNIANYASAVVSNTCEKSGGSDSQCNELKAGKACLNCSHGGSEGSTNTSFLFDRHMRGRETCWQSDKISQSKTINVTINLDKLFEVYYVTVEFCGKIPESIALFKSNDYGKTWSPWHYFAISCKNSFRLRQISTKRMERLVNSQKLDPVCFSLTKSLQIINNEYQVIPFNPMIGRNSIPHDSMAVKEWTSLTNLRISVNVNNSKSREASKLAISDVTIGGRVQCFGHASDMKMDNKLFVCDCHHKTDGRQCGKCLGTHNDQPWKPIFSSDSSARECQDCFCNNHAEECLFDLKVYTKSNGIHGSRCINCLHDTTGPNCELCSPGFFRNAAFPVSHKKVCQKCKCHTIGARSNINCDAVSGRCHCKDGVEGVGCNKCKKGYHQTRSPIRPCVPDFQKTMASTEERCGPCGKNRPQIKLKKFCRKQIIIKVSIQSKEIHGDWTRFGVQVEKIWRIQPSFDSQVNVHETELSTYPIWVENANIRCNCSNFELGHTYLLLTRIKHRIYLNQPELVVDKKSMVLRWRDSWSRRLDKFKEKEKQGKCEKFKFNRKYARRMFQNDNIRYIKDR